MEKLVYDKAKRTIVAQQAIDEHPLAKFGYRRPPHWLWRLSPRLFVITMALNDIRLIAIGKVTLHRAYQQGHDDGHVQEVIRRMRGGR